MAHQLDPHATPKDLLRAGEAIGLPRAVIPALIETWGPAETWRQFARAAAQLHGPARAGRPGQPGWRGAGRMARAPVGAAGAGPAECSCELALRRRAHAETAS